MKKLKKWSMRFSAVALSAVMAFSSPISVIGTAYANTIETSMVTEVDGTNLVTNDTQLFDANRNGNLEELTPPSDEELTPPSDEELTPPSDEELTPPSDEELTPPSDEELTPPSDEELTPPSDEELTPPSDEELTPPNNLDMAPTGKIDLAPDILTNKGFPMMMSTGPKTNVVQYEKFSIVDKPSNRNIYIRPGESYWIEVEYEPEDANEGYYFDLSYPDRMNVDEEGLVEANNVEGGCRVTVIGNISGELDYLNFTITNSAVKLTLDANGGHFVSDGKNTKDYYGKSTSNFSGLDLMVEFEDQSKCFDGKWYYDPECNNPVTFKSGNKIQISEDTVLYAGMKTQYEIIFDYDGVEYEGKTGSKVYVPSGEKLNNYGYPDFEDIAYPDPNVNGNRLFIGWLTESGEVISQKSLNSYIPKTDETIKAIWRDDFRIIKFIYGITYNGISEETFYVLPGDNIGTQIYLPDTLPEDNTKKFNGWMLSGSDKILGRYEVASYCPTGEKEEIWNASWGGECTITLDLNGGSYKWGNWSDQITVAEGQKINGLPEDYVLQKEGHKFAGWYVKGTDIEAKNGEYVVNTSVTLEARWNPEYTVTMDLMGGDCSSDYYKSYTVEAGKNIYLMTIESVYSKEGYLLAGWCEDSECKGTAYSGNYEPKGNITLYAKWVPIRKVTLNAGSGWFGNDSSNHVVVKEVMDGAALDYKLSASDWIPQATGVGFEGWYFDEACTKPVKMSYVVTNDITFYAKWDEYYTVTVHAGEGYYINENGDQVDTAILKVVKGSRITGHDVLQHSDTTLKAKYYLDSTFTTPYDMNYIPEDNVDLYAKWVKYIYISWDAKDGENAYGGSTGTIGTYAGDTISLPTVKKDGCTLSGWIKEDGTEIDGATRYYENTTIYAKWNSGYTVTFDLDGGALEPYYSAIYLPSIVIEEGEKIGLASRPYKEGYGFVGWKDEDGTIYPYIHNVIVTKDTKMTAQWQAGYKVTLHAGDGQFYDSDRGGYVDTKNVYVPGIVGKDADIVNASSPSHTRAGMSFAGYSFTENGEIVDLYPYTFTKDTELYAIYKPSNSMIFVMNGGYMDGYYQDTLGYWVLEGNALSYPYDSDIVRAGYTFAGWYLDADFSGDPIYIPDSQYVPNGSTIFYAKWEVGSEAKVTVKFDSRGGSSVDLQKVSIGELLEKPNDPTKSGYAFIGWYRDTTCTIPFDFAEPVEEGCTLYAGWVESMDLKDASVEIIGTYAYTGEVIIPKLKVMAGSRELTLGSEYTVSGGGTEVGEATVKLDAIVGTGITGSRTITFTIMKAKWNVSVPEISVTPEFGSKLKDVNLPDGWSWKTEEAILNKVGDQTFVAVYNVDTEHYEDFEAEISITVIPKSLENALVTVEGGPFVFNGTAITPTVKVTLENQVISNENYLVAFEANINAGTASIIITGIDNYKGEVRTIFVIDKADPEVLIGNQVYELTYGDVIGSIALPDGWSWKDSNEVSGNVTETKKFLANYTSPVGSNYGDKEDVQLNVKVIPKSINDDSIEINLTKEIYIYTGTAIAPDVIVKDSELNDITLVKDVDYTVSYENNVEIGTGNVIVTGIGNYANGKQKEFNIISDPYNLASAVISLSMTSASYSGEEIKPEVTVKVVDLSSGDGTLVLSPDHYTVTYTDNILPGFAIVTVTGNGSEGQGTYYGTQSVKFLIQMNSYVLNAVYSDQLMDLALPSGWTWDEPEAFVGDITAEGKLFDVSYAKDGEMVDDQSVLVKVSAKDIEDDTVSVNMDDSVVYDPDGETITEISITDTKIGRELVEGTDYIVSYGNNNQAGTATVTITGNGNYTGSIGDSFTIEQAEPNVVVENQKITEGKMDLSVFEDPFFLYTSFVGDGEVTFASSDQNVFTVENTLNEHGEQDGKMSVVGIGTATLTIEVSQTTNYKGTTLTYNVNVLPEDINSAVISLVENEFTFTGQEIQPEILVSWNGTAMVKDVDYQISYGTNINAGINAGSITVSGMNRFTGTTTKVFDIAKAVNPTEKPTGLIEAVYGEKLSNFVLPGEWQWKQENALVGNKGTNSHVIMIPETENYLLKEASIDVIVSERVLTDAMVELKYSTVKYDGTEKKPEILMKDSGLLTEADFTVAYAENVNVGTATVTITAKNNYTGVVTKTFTIEKADVAIRVSAGSTITKYITEKAFTLGAAASNGGVLTYTSSNENVATVDGNGTVTLVGIGSTNILIGYAGNENQNSARVEVALTVVRQSSSDSGSGSSSSSSSGNGSKGTSSSITKEQNVAKENIYLPPEYNGPTKIIENIVVPENVVEGNWTQDTNGNWNFKNETGESYVNTWGLIYNPYADLTGNQEPYNWFFFNEDGTMKTGWYTDASGDTYYLNPISDNTLGCMIIGWRLIDGKWYYFNTISDGYRGRMVRNAITADGYYVDANGIWDGKSLIN